MCGRVIPMTNNKKLKAKVQVRISYTIRRRSRMPATSFGDRRPNLVRTIRPVIIPRSRYMSRRRGPPRAQSPGIVAALAAPQTSRSPLRCACAPAAANTVTELRGAAGGLVPCIGTSSIYQLIFPVQDADTSPAASIRSAAFGSDAARVKQSAASEPSTAHRGGHDFQSRQWTQE